jgi:hypothetical protein
MVSGFTASKLQQIIRLGGTRVYRVFIETGTYQAKTALMARTLFPVVHTIERSEVLWKEAHQKYGGDGIHFHLGDTTEVLPKLAKGTREPAVFYLDAHWFDQPNVAGQSDPLPLWAELDCLAKRRQPDIIIVDDVRSFGTFPGWEDVTLPRVANRLKRYRKARILADQAVVWR